MTLEVKNLVGGYSKVPVLHQVSFTVEPGELVGLIGLNGAGKSTTINHLIGLLHPYSGSITLNGANLQNNPLEYKKQIAYVPETPVLYQELTLKEHIDLTIKAYGLNSQEAWQRAEHLLTTFRLANKLDWFPADFSKGMRQKVMIVCAFITQAKMMFVDEPFYGLDPLAVHDLLQLIQERKQNGVGFLMSTHVLDTAEKNCDRFVLLADGRVKMVGNLSQLQEASGMPGASLNDIYLKATQGD